MPTPGSTAQASPGVATEPATSDATPAVNPTSQPLQIWLPPTFAPDGTTPAGSVLAQQLAKFAAEHAGVVIQTRSKADSGDGELVRALAAAVNVAPTVVPDLVILNREQLVRASAAGLVTPLDKTLPTQILSDYYLFAQDMSRVDGEWLAVTFAADARVLVYDTAVYTDTPRLWDDLLMPGSTYVIPGAESSALTLLTEYLARGGALTDANGNPVLDPAPLAEALSTFLKAREYGALPLSALTFLDPKATWQTFREQRVTAAITSASWFLQETARAPSAAMSLPPTQGGTGLTLAEAWCWALVNKPEQQAEAAELLTWLAAPTRLAEWTQVSNLLPTRAATLAKLNNPMFEAAAEILVHARLRPPTEIMAAVSAPLQKALDDTVSGRLSPEAAATAAAQSVAKP
jgi:ABC-type glycerol-3-phosphate transport system substrate-binding protein